MSSPPSSIPAAQSNHSRGLLISLLVFAILNLPLPFWNCFYGFTSTDIYGFNNRYGDSSFSKIAGLGLAFGLVTLCHGVFGLIKITMFSIDIDHKLSAKSRYAFINACLSESLLFSFALQSRAH